MRQTRGAVSYRLRRLSNMQNKTVVDMKVMLWLMTVAVLSFAACEDIQGSGNGSSQGNGDTLEIVWEEPQQVRTPLKKYSECITSIRRQCLLFAFLISF